ncbi:MAG: ASCH domain-containing protein [Desulfovibrionaceae bacterium]
MSAYNFQARFASLVESGVKRQTIRATGKRRHARLGEPVQLYTGMRTRFCRKLIKPDPICIQTQSIEMVEFNSVVLIFINGELVQDAEALAVADGFYTFVDFINFFRRVHSFPFHGVLIRW